LIFLIIQKGLDYFSNAYITYEIMLTISVSDALKGDYQG